MPRTNAAKNSLVTFLPGHTPKCHFVTLPLDESRRTRTTARRRMCRREDELPSSDKDGTVQLCWNNNRKLSRTLIPDFCFLSHQFSSLSRAKNSTLKSSYPQQIHFPIPFGHHQLEEAISPWPCGKHEKHDGQGKGQVNSVWPSRLDPF